MGYYAFFKIKGEEGGNTGYFVPRLYRMPHSIALKIYGLRYVKDLLRGYRIWWVGDREDYLNAFKTLEELKKTRLFDYKICGPFY